MNRLSKEIQYLIQDFIQNDDDIENIFLLDPKFNRKIYTVLTKRSIKYKEQSCLKRCYAFSNNYHYKLAWIDENNHNLGTKVKLSTYYKKEICKFCDCCFSYQKRYAKNDNIYVLDPNWKIIVEEPYVMYAEQGVCKSCTFEKMNSKSKKYNIIQFQHFLKRNFIS